MVSLMEQLVKLVLGKKERATLLVLLCCYYPLKRKREKVNVLST